jgi:hypothetical protein
MTTTTQEINACSFDQWYPVFNATKQRTTLRSTIIPLDDEFIEYLKQDGVVLPTSLSKVNDEGEDDFGGYDNSSDEEDEDKQRKIQEQFEQFKQQYMQQQTSDDEEEEEEEQVDQLCPEFTELIHSIQQCLEEYDGAVFPKLNWSCPRDAQWILTDSKFLKCTTVEDVFLVLKSSRFIIHDIEDAYVNAIDNEKTEQQRVKPVLICRKWYDLDISMEFRCFIRNKQLVGISQRHLQYFEFLKKERYSILEPLILEFWNNQVSDVFPLDNYTVDVYIQRNKQRIEKSRVYIVDFNIYGAPTDPLLFESWENEVLLPNGPTYDSVIFRLVESEMGTIKPSYRTYGGVPSDLYDPDISEQIENKELLTQFFNSQ